MCKWRRPRERSAGRFFRSAHTCVIFVCTTFFETSGWAFPYTLIKLFPVRHVRSGSVAGVADSYFRPVGLKNTADHVISLTPQFAWNYRRRVHPIRPATVAGDGWRVIINDDVMNICDLLNLITPETTHLRPSAFQFPAPV